MEPTETPGQTFLRIPQMSSLREAKRRHGIPLDEFFSFLWVCPRVLGEFKKRKEEAEEIKKKKLEEKLKKQKEKLTKKPKVSVRRSRRRHSLSSEDEEQWQPSGYSEDEPQQEDFPEPVEEEVEPHELSLEAEVTTRSLNEIAEKGEQPHNLVVAEHPQEESLEHLEEEFQLADSTIQPNVNSENGMLSNDMIIESIFDLEGLDMTHKDYAERDREDRDEEGKTRETESEDYAERDGEDRDEEGKTREKESEDNIIDSGKKNLKGSFVLATFQKPRGSFNMVCEVVSRDDTFASVFTYGQVTRNAINRFARTSRETKAIRLDQILENLPSPTKFGFGINIKYEFPIPPLRLM
ncbi:hypothetical protein GE061_008394 [Apolygus lucorum]|uniref:Uncharacterized protein n=1 Tax=Apolygus lucorum TaxID=248454 RepID=A0A8S9WPH5_APOLU|nr:hypothetical protein GE061_008394 [Apolygus lucorum]